MIMKNLTKNEKRVLIVTTIIFVVFTILDKLLHE